MFKVGDIVRMVKHTNINTLKRWGNRNLVVLACVGNTVFVEPVNNKDGVLWPNWLLSNQFAIVTKKLVVLSDKYVLLMKGDVIYEYEKRNGYYYIKGRRYLLSSFKEVDINEVVEENKKPDIDKIIDKWFDVTTLRMKGNGEMGLCAYSMLFVNTTNGKWFNRDQILDICHARISPRENSDNVQAVAVCTDVFRKNLNENQTRYMDFILNRSHFASTFIGNKDVNTRPVAVKMDVNKGLNEIAVAAILVRTVWEHHKNAQVFVSLVDAGISEHVAMLFAWLGDELRNSGSHHIFHSGVDLKVLKDWIKTGAFIDTGAPYRKSRASYQVSPGIWGDHPGFEALKPGSISGWCHNIAKELDIKKEERWGVIYHKGTTEQLIQLAKQFEKEL